MPVQSIASQPRLLELGEVSKQTSLGRSTVLAWEATGRFPRAVRLSRSKRVWLESDVAAWILGKHAEAQTKQHSAA